MSKALFAKALAVQALAVGIVFAVLVALPLREGFFEDYGLITGPVAWIACSLVTAQVLRMPTGYVLFAALAGGVAGVLVSLVTSHTVGLIISLLVFGASCAGYEPEHDAPQPV
ncbi:MAG: hypothetical protein GXY03_15745 [Solirubrobacterales bacterium]|nr:hypothetical protein [Solirubrobacterales bacterium]